MLGVGLSLKTDPHTRPHTRSKTTLKLPTPPPPPPELQLLGVATRGNQYKHYRTNAYKDSFFPSSIRLWNQLPEKLTTVTVSDPVYSYYWVRATAETLETFKAGISAATQP